MAMFEPFKKLKLASAFLGVAEDPARADATLELGEVFGRVDLRGLGLDVARLLEQDGVRALYDSRYLPQPEPLDRLMDNGEGTLGYEVARYLRAQQQPRLVGPPAGFDFRDPAAYLALRVRMTHPVVHVLTEYDASPLGELAVQSFYVGQLGNLVSGVMISSALLQITRDMPDKLGDALAILAEAYQRGRAARPILGIAWEELWSAQVPQLRELADLTPRGSTIARLDLDAREPEPPPRERPRSPSSAHRASFSLDAPSPPASPSSSAAATASTAASRKPEADSRPEPARQRPISQSSLLASFMALAEQENRAQSKPADDEEAEPELVDPSPARAPKPPPPPPRQPVFAPPPPVQPAPAPRPAVIFAPPVPPVPPAPPVQTPPPPTVPQPGFSVEEADPKIQPALSPDDPDFF